MSGRHKHNRLDVEEKERYDDMESLTYAGKTITTFIVGLCAIAGFVIAIVAICKAYSINVDKSVGYETLVFTSNITQGSGNVPVNFDADDEYFEVRFVKDENVVTFSSPGFIVKNTTSTNGNTLRTSQAIPESWRVYAAENTSLAINSARFFIPVTNNAPVTSDQYVGQMFIQSNGQFSFIADYLSSTPHFNGTVTIGSFSGSYLTVMSSGVLDP